MPKVDRTDDCPVPACDELVDLDVDYRCPGCGKDLTGENSTAARESRAGSTT